MSNEFPIEGGVKVKFDPHTYGVYWTNNFPVGYELNVGFGNPDVDPVAGMRAVGVAATFADDASAQSAITAAGGYGPFMISKMPAINAIMQAHFLANPQPAPIANNAPWDFTAANDVLYEYFAIVPDAKATPTFVRKSYP